MKGKEYNKHFPCRPDPSFHNRMIKLRDQTHQGCFVCDPETGCGLGIRFAACSDGSVEGKCLLGTHYKGYSDIVHGGVLAALADGAMVNCLFAHGIITFVHPIELDLTALALGARIEIDVGNCPPRITYRPN